MKRLLATLTCLLFFQLNLWSQNLEQRVTLHYREVLLEEVLQELSEQYSINISYGGYPRALEKRISIGVADMPLDKFLSLILNKAGLTYKVIGGNVVLRQLEQNEGSIPADTPQTIKAPDQSLPPVSVRSKLKQQEALPQIHPIIPASLVQEQVPEWAMPQGVVMQEKIIPDRKKPSTLMIAPVFSLDVAHPELKSRYNTDQRIAADLGYSAGVAGYWKVSDKLSLEIMFLLRKKNLTLWYGIETVEDPMGLPVKTEALLSYLQVPLSMHFRLCGYKRLSLQGVSSLFGSYLLEGREKTWLDDGRMFPTTAMLISSLSPFIWGLQGGLLFSYALNDKVSFMMTPLYQYTINGLARGVQQLRMQELIFRSSILFSL
jgi:hypothetical protein